MIYADNAATTRISDTVFEKMLPFLREQYGNASSQYSFGVEAKRAIEQARAQFSLAINALPEEIIFTSGGSEANSWILKVIAETYCREKIHIITSIIEHNSVLNTCRALEQKNVEITYLPVNSIGAVSVADVMSAIKPNTKLISIMLANNEIGTIQPIAEIGKNLNGTNILFHSDAVQAVGHIPVDVHDLQVDFLTASAHKFNGAKGTGILYKRVGRKLLPWILGGMQEQGFRAGTENVAGIIAAGCAVEESLALMAETTKSANAMVAATAEAILSKLPSTRINGDVDNCLPGIINLGFEGISGESLMHLLNLRGICVSTSSACTSNKGEPSHVLMALGLTPQQAKSAIRISYGRYNELKDADIVVREICDAYRKIKTIL